MPVGDFWIQLVQLLEPDGSSQGKRRVSLLYSDSMMLLHSSAYSRMFLRKMFMTLGRLKWSGREEIVNGELERSQLVVCTVIEMKVLLDFKLLLLQPSSYKPCFTIWFHEDWCKRYKFAAAR